MTRPAKRQDVVEIEIPASDIRKHNGNKRGLQRALDGLAQDNFSRAQRALSRKFYAAAATMAFLGSIGAAASAFDSNQDNAQKSTGFGIMGAFSAALFVSAGWLTRPATLPLSTEGRSNLVKEVEGRQIRYNAFYHRHLGEAPSFYVDSRDLR
jgi:hypothetical protein